jgi:4-hydroxybenzoate polyprenyltransferase
MTKFKSIIKLLRVDQWLKNLLIFAPILFSLDFKNIHAIISAAIAFVGFSFIASSIYIINDWFDIEADRLHPKKKFRPLASGAVSKREGIILIICLIILGLSIFLALGNINALLLVISYLLLNLAYSFRLKQFAIIDITIVALGFVIRLFVGGLITGVYLSHWIIIMTFLLALLLVLGKRKHDVSIYEKTGISMRKSISGYNSDFLTAIIIVVTSITILAYIMYTISPEVVGRNGENLYLTSLFVILGLLRYLQVIFLEKGGDNPTKLFIKDRFIHIDIICWLISFIGISLLEKI